MTRLGDLGAKIGDKIAEGLVGKIAKVVGGGILFLLVGAWVWIWYRVNPEFDYKAVPSSLNSHFVSLNEVFNSIDKDSRLYCSGGWDQRIAWAGLRKCYDFTFVPTTTYKMTICTHDERTAQVKTSDQLVAIRYFEKRFASLECFRCEQQGNIQQYNIAPGIGSHFRTLQYPNDPPQEVAFCGCNDKEEEEIVKVAGGTLLHR